MKRNWNNTSHESEGRHPIDMNIFHRGRAPETGGDIRQQGALALHRVVSHLFVFCHLVFRFENNVFVHFTRSSFTRQETLREDLCTRMRTLSRLVFLTLS